MTSKEEESKNATQEVDDATDGAYREREDISTTQEVPIGFSSDVVDHIARQQLLTSSNPVQMLADIFEQQGISAEFAKMILGCGSELFAEGEIEAGVIAGLHQFLQFDAVAPTGGAIAMVGPPKSGKSLATLRFVDHLKRLFHYKVAIVEIVSEKSKQSDHLNRWARLLEIPLIQIEWRWGVFVPLRDQLEKLQQADVVVIDTPGFCASEPEKIRALCGDLNMINEVERMLVLPADVSEKRDKESLSPWFIPGFERVLVTGIDRAGFCGGVFDLLYHRDKALSYFASGAALPGGIEPASADQVLKLLMRQFH
jgi:flagellar biosynthesis GTPase FlhF